MIVPYVNSLLYAFDSLSPFHGKAETVGAAGNLVTDAQIAALAIEYDAVVHTADADFLRFPGVRWRNPITGASSRGLNNG